MSAFLYNQHLQSLKDVFVFYFQHVEMEKTLKMSVLVVSTPIAPTYMCLSVYNEIEERKKNIQSKKALLIQGIINTQTLRKKRNKEWIEQISKIKLLRLMC